MSGRNQAHRLEREVARQRGWHVTDKRLHDVDAGERLVEIKSCKESYPSGRTGRWKVFKGKHEERLEHGISYYLLVFDSGDLIYEVWVSAETMDDFFNEMYSWQRSGGHRCGEKEIKMTWRKFRDWYGE